MLAYETKYLHTTESILDYGDFRSTRNGHVKSVFYKTLRFNMSYGEFPVITSRKMNVDGILGEYAAIIRGPKNIKDFQKWGCNYWNEFGDPDTGELRLSYGNSWYNFNGVNQVRNVLNNLRANPYDRRHIISAWNPEGMEDLSLPPCHFLYQFYVDEDKYDKEKTLSMLMYSRSGDWMVGIPSDMVFGATMLACWSNLIGAKSGTLKLMVADAHIYSDHFSTAWSQIENGYVHYDANYHLQPQFSTEDFEPKHMEIYNYEHKGNIKYELKT